MVAAIGVSIPDFRFPPLLQGGHPCHHSFHSSPFLLRLGCLLPPLHSTPAAAAAAALISILPRHHLRSIQGAWRSVGCCRSARPAARLCTPWMSSLPTARPSTSTASSATTAREPSRNILTLLSNRSASVPGQILISRIIFASHFSTFICPGGGGQGANLFHMPIATFSLPVERSILNELPGLWRWQLARYTSNALVTLNTDDSVARFSLDKPSTKPGVQKKGMKKLKRPKMSRRAKVNQLKWYRLKAKKKMKSPNPEVRIRYKLEKAKRKEEWLIEKLRKLEIPKSPEPVHDPEILTEEMRFYLKRTGEKKKNYVPVGRRGVFGGVVLNMHLHWKKHETVKVICKPCKPGQIHEYAEELVRLSKGTVIDIKANTIIFYRGKNYEQPEVMSPPDTLSKQKALEKYQFMQSLEHTSQFIERLENDLEEYQKHIALYRKSEDTANKLVVDGH